LRARIHKLRNKEKDYKKTICKNYRSNYLSANIRYPTPSSDIVVEDVKNEDKDDEEEKTKKSDSNLKLVNTHNIKK
jgi:hypothetical protein